MMEEDPVTPIGWDEIDELLFGGIARKEMLLFSANSGGGKSIVMANVALNFVEKGMNVLYISLELSEDVVAQRFDTMVTGISRKSWKQHTSEIITRVKADGENNGILDIMKMPSGSTANDIRAYLKEYYLHYNFMPDMLVLDYLDKMNPNEKVSADNVFEKDKRVSEQLRDIGVDENMFIVTASQLNRSAVNATTHDHSQIAGGISKINETDVYMSILLDDAMKAQGDICFNLLKTRSSDGVGNTVYMKWDNKYLRVRNPDDDDRKPGLELKKKKENDLFEQSGPSGGLLGIMDC